MQKTTNVNAISTDTEALLIIQNRINQWNTADLEGKLKFAKDMEIASKFIIDTYTELFKDFEQMEKDLKALI